MLGFVPHPNLQPWDGEENAGNILLETLMEVRIQLASARCKSVRSSFDFLNLNDFPRAKSLCATWCRTWFAVNNFVSHVNQYQKLIRDLSELLSLF